jgi:hypothetical protein
MSTEAFDRDRATAAMHATRIRAAARRAADLARSAAATAYNAHRAGLRDSPGTWNGPGDVAPLERGVPRQPLACVLRDLAATASAAADATHLAALSADPWRVQRFAEAATAAADATMLATAAFARHDDAALRAPLAHAAARCVHLAADLLDRPATSPPTGIPHESLPNAFPPSHRAVLVLLSQHLGKARHAQPFDVRGAERRVLIDAGSATRDGAAHALAAYERAVVRDGIGRAACRCARIAMRASCQAGFAVLEPLSAGSGRQLQVDREERASVQRYLARARRMRPSLIRRWWLGCL